MEIQERFQTEQTLSLEKMKSQIFAHWVDESWHEVLCLLAGMIAPRFVAQVLEYLVQQLDPQRTCHAIFLATRCVGEVRKRNELGPIADGVLDRIKALIRFDLNFFYEAWEEKVTRVAAIRTRAVCTVALVWRDAHETLPWLKQRATNDEDGAVRRAAVQELARGWKDDPDTLPILKQRATNDGNWAVRQAAVLELARGWKDDPDTLPWLKQRATNDENYNVRKAAVRKLARGWTDDPDTLPILKQRATNDEDWTVRQAAVRELARGWKDDSDTLVWLKQRATFDED
jgi:predicted NACHT family NTPase